MTEKKVNIHIEGKDKKVERFIYKMEKLAKFLKIGFSVGRTSKKRQLKETDQE